MVKQSGTCAILSGFSDAAAAAIRARLALANIDVVATRIPPDQSPVRADIIICRFDAVERECVRALASTLRVPALLVVDLADLAGTSPSIDYCAVFGMTDGFVGIESTAAMLVARDTECEKYHDAYHHSMHGICTHRMLFDENGTPFDCRYLEVNEAFAAVTGISRESAIGKTIRDLFPREDSAGIIKLYSDALSSGKGALREIFFGPTGEWYRLSITKRRGDDFTVFIDNVSDRKEAERALRNAEWHFRSIVDSGLSLIWTSDVHGRCDYFNESWLRFTGRALEEELGDGWAVGVQPEDLDRCVSTYRDAFAARVEFRMEYRLRAADGSYRWIEDRGLPRYDESGAFVGFVGHCVDIDARMVAERELHEKIAELERFHRLTIDREMRIIDLKREVNEALALCGRGERYSAIDEPKLRAATYD